GRPAEQPGAGAERVSADPKSWVIAGPIGTAAAVVGNSSAYLLLLIVPIAIMPSLHAPRRREREQRYPFGVSAGPAAAKLSNAEAILEACVRPLTAGSGTQGWRRPCPHHLHLNGAPPILTLFSPFLRRGSQWRHASGNVCRPPASGALSGAALS